VRALIVNPLVLAVSAGLGLALCALLGWDAHPREMAWALAVCLIAAEAGSSLLPLRHTLAVHPAQAGLLATVLHLMLATVLAGAVLFVRRPPMAFVNWLLPFYWVTLMAVTVAAVRVVRSESQAPLPPVSQ
jgi:hypothetical protein